MSLGEVADAAGLPKSTTHRVVNELVEWGALERDGQRLRLGAYLFELGTLVSFSRQLREAALPFMEDLYVTTRQIVHLGILDNCDVLYVEKICGRQRADVPTRLGGRMPATCTALGKAMLALSSAEVVDDVLQAGLVRLTPHTITDPGVFRRELRSILAEGVAYDREESAIGATCVAAPILAANDQPIAAISVTGPTDSFAPQRMAATIRMTAVAVSRELVNQRARGPIDVLGRTPDSRRAR